MKTSRLAHALHAHNGAKPAAQLNRTFNLSTSAISTLPQSGRHFDMPIQPTPRPFPPSETDPTAPLTPAFTTNAASSALPSSLLLPLETTFHHYNHFQLTLPPNITPSHQPKSTMPLPSAIFSLQLDQTSSPTRLSNMLTAPPPTSFPSCSTL
jgi:hypothetical protein